MSIKYEPASPKQQNLTADKEVSTALQSTLFKELMGGLHQSTHVVKIDIYHTIHPFERIPGTKVD